MEEYTSPVFLLKELIRFPSVTPRDGGAISFLENVSEALGFTVERPIFRDPSTEAIENFYAKCGNTGPSLMFAGHIDVVPPGDEEWTYPAFSGEIVKGFLYGRGAVDMKGGLACFLAAVARQRSTLKKGRISLLISGDEEGLAINGTVKLLRWAEEKGEAWDAALLGEPTCKDSIGDTIKVGRRGSLSGVLRINGRQGHVAYPDLAYNPIPVLITFLRELLDKPFDEGTKHFKATNLEIINMDSFNKTTNLIPYRAEACFNIRFNDLWSSEQLMIEIENRLSRAAKVAFFSDYSLSWLPNPADVFITYNNDEILLKLSNAIFEVIGKKPRMSTAGGTSDARFIKDYCPVVEFGLVGKTMHRTNECVDLNDLETLTAIYQNFIRRFFE
ncbi:MAG: succinyl-diaminopimelate desuccinylase [Candidatus Tokpelaia sp. JSC161]|jgi:succinyl-diaminopimelate desuccinylase|nr:MAG: succinyl-diaminopimelate desuccinylase [Candidatus Tokpelaia sp. JSC161]